MLGFGRGTKVQKLRLAFSVIVIIAIAGFMAYSTGPSLLRDWRLRGVETVEVASRLDDGSCRVYLFAINFCNLKLTTEHTTLDDTLLFFDMGHSEGYDVVVRADPNDPTQVTTTVGLEMFWDRVITLAVFLGLFVIGIFSSIVQLLKRDPQPAN